MFDNEDMRGLRKKLGLLLVAGIIVGLGITIFGGFTRGLPTLSKSSTVPTTPGERNTVRRAALKELASALKRYTVEVGKLPVIVTAAPVGICSNTGAVCKAAKQTDLMFLAARGYVEALPSDPSGAHERFATGYTLSRTPAGTLVLTAPRAENGAIISQVVE